MIFITGKALTLYQWDLILIKLRHKSGAIKIRQKPVQASAIFQSMAKHLT